MLVRSSPTSIAVLEVAEQIAGMVSKLRGLPVAVGPCWRDRTIRGRADQDFGRDPLLVAETVRQTHAQADGRIAEIAAEQPAQYPQGKALRC